MHTRRATAEEIIAYYHRHIEWGWKVLVKTFIKEMNNPRAKNGVTHRSHVRRALKIIDGVPHITHHGKLEPITGLFVELDGGTTLVAELRLDSPHLH